MNLVPYVGISESSALFTAFEVKVVVPSWQSSPPAIDEIKSAPEKPTARVQSPNPPAIDEINSAPDLDAPHVVQLTKYDNFVKAIETPTWPHFVLPSPIELGISKIERDLAKLRNLKLWRDDPSEIHTPTPLSPRRTTMMELLMRNINLVKAIPKTVSDRKTAITEMTAGILSVMVAGRYMLKPSALFFDEESFIRFINGDKPSKNGLTKFLSTPTFFLFDKLVHYLVNWSIAALSDSQFYFYCSLLFYPEHLLTNQIFTCAAQIVSILLSLLPRLMHNTQALISWVIGYFYDVSHATLVSMGMLRKQYKPISSEQRAALINMFESRKRGEEALNSIIPNDDYDTSGSESIADKMDKWFTTIKEMEKSGAYSQYVDVMTYYFEKTLDAIIDIGSLLSDGARDKLNNKQTHSLINMNVNIAIDIIKNDFGILWSFSNGRKIAHHFDASIRNLPKRITTGYEISDSFFTYPQMTTAEYFDAEFLKQTKQVRKWLSEKSFIPSLNKIVSRLGREKQQNENFTDDTASIDDLRGSVRPMFIEQAVAILTGVHDRQSATASSFYSLLLKEAVKLPSNTMILGAGGDEDDNGGDEDDGLSLLQLSELLDSITF
jgi:hypothetical protein